MEILQHPNTILDQKTRAVEKVTPELVNIAKQMYSIMIEANGVGLSANQVGLDISLMVMSNNGEPLILFNPVLMEMSKDTNTGPEGCLSFIGTTCIIKRANQVKIKYRDEYNKMQFKVLTGLSARCFIHELEHLRGLNFLSKNIENIT